MSSQGTPPSGVPCVASVTSLPTGRTATDGDPTQRARQQSGLLTRRCSAALLAAEDATAERIDGEKGTRGEGPTHEQRTPLRQAPLPQAPDDRAPQTHRPPLPERLRAGYGQAVGSFGFVPPGVPALFVAACCVAGSVMLGFVLRSSNP